MRMRIRLPSPTTYSPILSDNSRRRPWLQSFAAQWRDRFVFARSAAAVVSERRVGPKRWTVRCAGYKSLCIVSLVRNRSAFHVSLEAFNLVVRVTKEKYQLDGWSDTNRESCEEKDTTNTIQVEPTGRGLV